MGCKEEGGSEVAAEDGKQVQEEGQGSVAHSPVGIHLLVHGIVVIKQSS
jgi:hypothetical protein